ncbi:MAG: sulfotransferase, partial [Armatimonadetes bacterium]|nr:sulfotransferase [Anaerolineae bacterium]
RNFVANLNPPRPTIREAQINLVKSYWQAPAAAIGKPIWGFKEVLYDAQMALTLKDLFPTAKIIYITRHPFKCFTSLLHEERLKPGETYVPLKEIWTRNRTIEALNHWVRINRSFLETPGLDGDWLYQMTCEQLVADIPGKTHDLIAWLGLQPDDFDYSLFDYKIYTDRHSNEDDRPTLTWADLSAEEYTLLTSDDVLSVTQRLGYAMPAPRHKPSTPGMY